MRILLVGAGGFLGRSIGKALASAGHEVRAFGPSASPGPDPVTPGIHWVKGSILDPESLRPAARGTDLVIHVAQPSMGDLTEMRRVRVEGCERLVAAMRSVGARRLLIGSGYWVYPGGEGEIREESPIAPRSISQVNYDTEQVARKAADSGELEVSVIRPGMVYGVGSWFAGLVERVRAGRYHYLGDGGQFLSPIHIQDLADAFCQVGERWRSGALVLAVDDRPVSSRELAERVALHFGSATPTGEPIESIRRQVDPDLLALNLASRRASNGHLRSLGWIPRFPTIDTGLPDVLSGWPEG